MPETVAGAPAEPPPAYSEQQPSAHLDHNAHVEPLPLDDDGRASMEDEDRDLPPGWVRQFDSNQNHNFYVDTNANPVRSIWVHPYFDEQFHREKPQDVPEDYRGMFSHQDQSAGNNGTTSRTLHDPQQRKRWWGEKVKDKLTGSTHEQREQKREQRREHQRQIYMIEMERERQFMERRRQMASQLGYPRGAYAAPAYPYRRGYGGGGMGMGLPLMGGLGTGLLLGGAMDGGFGGDFGGGDGGGC